MNHLNEKEPSQNNSFELVESLVLSLLDEKSGGVTLTPDTNLKDIGFDSIKFLNLFLSLEDIVNVDLETIVSEVDPSSVQKINDVVSIVEKFRS